MGLERAAFLALQLALLSPMILVYYNHNQALYIDLDLSKKKGISAIVYYI
jgi:hypothetical protein